MKRSRACADLTALESTASSSCLSFADIKRPRVCQSNISIYRGESEDSVDSLSDELASSVWVNFLENGVVKQRNSGVNRSWILDIDDSDAKNGSMFDCTSKKLLQQITTGALYSKLRRPSIDIHMTYPSHAIRKGSFEVQRTQD